MCDEVCELSRDAPKKDEGEKKVKIAEDVTWVPPYVETTPDQHPLIPLPRPPTTVELRGGVLMVGCTCLKRDGMQHDCHRSECQGKSECLNWPAPVCEPSGLAPPRKVSNIVKKTDAPECSKQKADKPCTDAPAPPPPKVRAAPVKKGPLPGQVVVWSRKQVPCRSHQRWGYYKVPPKVRTAGTQTQMEIFNQPSSIELLTK